MWTKFILTVFLLICHLMVGSFGVYVYQTSFTNPKMVLVTADDSGKILPGSPLTLKLDGDDWMFGMVSELDENGKPQFTYFDDAKCEWLAKEGVECRPSHEPGKNYVKLYNPAKEDL